MDDDALENDNRGPLDQDDTARVPEGAPSEALSYVDDRPSLVIAEDDAEWVNRGRQEAGMNALLEISTPVESAPVPAPEQSTWSAQSGDTRELSALRQLQHSGGGVADLIADGNEITKPMSMRTVSRSDIVRAGHEDNKVLAQAREVRSFPVLDEYNDPRAEQR